MSQYVPDLCESLQGDHGFASFTAVNAISIFFLLYYFLEIHRMTNVQRLVVRRLEIVTLKLTLLMRIHKW